MFGQTLFCQSYAESTVEMLQKLLVEKVYFLSLDISYFFMKLSLGWHINLTICTCLWTSEDKDTQPRFHSLLSWWRAITHCYCFCSRRPSMWCFLFLVTVRRLCNPQRGGTCLNTRLSLQRGHSSTLTHIQAGHPGNVWGHGPPSPSGLTDSLALVRYFQVTLGFDVAERPTCQRQDVSFMILCKRTIFKKR